MIYLGRAWIFGGREKLEARKMLVNRADSQKSAARCVGRNWLDEFAMSLN
jgi:hypothetical protein